MAYANSRLVEWGLFLFSTFITIVTLCNVIEYANILNGPTNSNFSDDSAQYWLVVNVILLVIAVIYWGYRVYHILFNAGARNVINEKLSTYFTKTGYEGLIPKEVVTAAVSSSSSSSSLTTPTRTVGVRFEDAKLL
jgi:hypothetical protein